MGTADYLELGTWNAECSMCGRKRKANQMVKNWQGMWRCPEHNETRQPQDFVRAVPDVQTTPWAQPHDATYVYQQINATESEDLTVATAGVDTLLNIWENVVIAILTFSGTGTVVINNYGRVVSVVNPGPAVLTVHNFGIYP